MPYRTDVAYLYDGSFNGLLCCVYESYYQKELPFSIFSHDQEQETIFSVKKIFTDEVKAKKVENSIGGSISQEALRMVRFCYLSHIENKEMAILRFLRMGYKVGSSVTDMLAHEDVRVITKAVQNVQGESHLFTGFLRFSEYSGVLAAIIEPKNFVLPIIAPHFCDRLPNEEFLIYDKTHKHAFIYQNGEKNLFPIENLELPPICEKEKRYRELWKQFYDTIAIEGRINPKLQMNNMPKRYWAHMTEFLK